MLLILNIVLLIKLLTEIVMMMGDDVASLNDDVV